MKIFDFVFLHLGGIYIFISVPLFEKQRDQDEGPENNEADRQPGSSAAQSRQMLPPVVDLCNCMLVFFDVVIIKDI